MERITEILALFAGLFLLFGVPSLLVWDASKSLRKLVLTNLALIFVISSISLAFAYRPNPLLQLAHMLFPLYCIVFAVLNLRSVSKYRSTHKFKSLIPLGLSIVSVPAMWASNLAGHDIRSYVFKTRLQQYENAARLFIEQINDQPISLSGTQIPEQYRHLAYTICATQYTPDMVAVEFFYGSGFPVKHSAYVYVSDPDLPDKELDFRRRWPRRQRINDHWLRASD